MANRRSERVRPHIRWSDEQLRAAQLDRKRLEALVRQLESCSKELTAMRLHVYGSDGSGYLIHRSRPEHDEKTGRMDDGAVIADIGFGFDGGGW